MAPSAPHDAIQRVLDEDLGKPFYLTRSEVAGGWRDLFPELVDCLPAPYPIYGRDEEQIVAHGYPVQVSASAQQLRREMEKQLELEVEFRVVMARGGQGDKGKVMAQRERYLRTMSAVSENALLNDYGRHLLELLLLFHSSDLAALLGRGSAVARRLDPEADRGLGESLRYALAGVFADLLQRASLAAVGRLKRLARAAVTPRLSPLPAVLCQDGLLLTETAIPTELSQLRGYLQVRLRLEAAPLVAACQRAVERLADLTTLRPDLAAALALACGSELVPPHPRLLLQPRLLDALVATRLMAELGLESEQIRVLRELGLRLKRLELLATLRRRVVVIEDQSGGLTMTGRTGQVPVALSTRPFDFTSPGVVESSVRRFGLVYDLSNFTAQLEEVRKKGRMAEEKALQFMYIFQGQLEEIRRRRRLFFEKFLGDGAFYSARRVLRVVAAACEIQRAYDQLRRSGFPFDQGMRMAMNYGTYRLLPMLSRSGEQRFEFFGHGIVELVRLTTGKSTREVEQIAEFLVHSGFDPGAVDAFLAPLLTARGGREGGAGRSYGAWIDGHGELVNEGMVASLPFVEELERDLAELEPRLLESDGLRWAALPVDLGSPGGLHFALRYLGVVRLKGLQPLELVEVRVCDEVPADTPTVPAAGGLVALLRRLAAERTEVEAEAAEGAIPEDLIVVTYLEPGGERLWVFGEYRAGDDVLLHAIQVTLRPPDMAPGESLEGWLFARRFELLRLYEDLRRGVTGVPMPLATLRQHRGYLGCFLAAPHRSPA